jgi:predicted transcriptional regulator
MTESEAINKLKTKIEEHEKRISKLEMMLPDAKLEASKMKTSIKEFILKKNPINDTQKALAIGYYLEKYEAFISFNSKDLEKGFRDSREKIPPNVSDKIQLNTKNGHIMEYGEKDGLKAYVLTNSGERFLENGFKEV